MSYFACCRFCPHMSCCFLLVIHRTGFSWRRTNEGSVVVRLMLPLCRRISERASDTRVALSPAVPDGGLRVVLGYSVAVTPHISGRTSDLRRYGYFLSHAMTTGWQNLSPLLPPPGFGARELSDTTPTFLWRVR